MKSPFARSHAREAAAHSGRRRGLASAREIITLQQHVEATCAKHKAPITAIETLSSGGTRVVLMNAVDAAKIGKAYGNKVMTGPVVRTPTRLMHG